MTTTADNDKPTTVPEVLEALKRIASINGDDYMDGGIAVMKSIARAALAEYEAVKDAERRFEVALNDLRELGCEPAMVRQSELAFRLYNVLQTVRENAGYINSETPDYAVTSGGIVEWPPGYFAGWMSGTHDLLEEFRETIANPDGL